MGEGGQITLNLILLILIRIMPITPTGHFMLCTSRFSCSASMSGV
jgi:hypothetical protein